MVAWSISATTTAQPGTAAPVTGGSVQGAGPYADGAAVTLVAVPAPGFAFVGWEEGGATVATTARYAFTASADRSLTARFALRHPFVDRILDRGDTATVAVGDFDGDGHADDLVADCLWLNNGRAGYRLGPDHPTQCKYTVSGVGTELINIAFDADGDGDLDLVLGNSISLTVNNQVWLNDGHGAFAAGPTLEADYTYGVILADLDRDGDLDLVTVNNQVWLNDGHVFTRIQTLSPSTNASATLGDLDGDGDPDLVISGHAFGGYATAPWHAWLNDGSGAFSDAGEIRPPEPAGTPTAWQALLADFDADGAPDLAAFVDDATGSGTTSTIQIYRNAAAP